MSIEMDRRTFMKGATTAFLGLATAPLLVTGQSFAQSEKKTAIDYRTLGKTGLKVSAVSMGVMNCSDPSVILRAYDLGVNYFDTARRYMNGRNEEIVGKALKGKRDKVYIETKVRWSSNLNENRESVEKSLKALQTDYADVLLVHAMKAPEEVSDPEIMSFLQAMKKEGKARFTGFSTHTDMAALLNAAAKAGGHDVILVTYNFTHSEDLKEAIAQVAQAGIGVVAMKTQAGGYTAEDLGGLSPHQAALGYVLKDSNISAAIPGVTTIEQLEELFAVMGKDLTKKDAQVLQKYDSYLQGRICTMCGGCEGECPHGVDHKDFMRVAMYFDGYKNRQLAQQVFEEGKLLQASRICGDCSSCSITCARGVDVRAQIGLVKRAFA